MDSERDPAQNAPRPSDVENAARTQPASLAASQTSSRRNSNKLRSAANLSAPQQLETPQNPTDQGDEQETAQKLQQTIELMRQSNPTDPLWTQLQGGCQKLLNLFLQARDNEQRLSTQCSDLARELTSNTTKLEEAIGHTKAERDQLVNALQTEKESLHGQLSAAHAQVASLQGEVGQLQQSLQQQQPAQSDFVYANAGKTRNEQASADGGALLKLLQEKEELTRKAQTASQTIAALESKITETNEAVAAEVENRAVLDNEINMLRDMLSTRKSEQDRDQRLREKLEHQLKTLNDTLARKDGEVHQHLNEASNLQDMVTKLEQQLRDEAQFANKIKKEREVANTCLLRLQQDFEEQSLQCTALQNEQHEQAQELKQWESKLLDAKENLKHANRAKDALTKQNKQLEDEGRHAAADRDALRAANHNLELELTNLKRGADLSNKRNNSLALERDLAHKNYVKAMGATQKQTTLVKTAEQNNRSLEHEITAFRDEASKMRKLIFSLERERDNHLSEITALQKQVEERDAELKIKDLSVFDSRKKVSEVERKLKEQQALYESVRSDRNLYSKNLVESQDELLEVRRKLKILSHQIEQLKDEVAVRENVITKDRYEHTKLEKDKEKLAVQLSRAQQELEVVRSSVQAGQTEQDKLQKLITERETVISRLEKDYAAVVLERDTLGAHLIKRDEEIELLYQKLRLQTVTLAKGEAQYRERLEDIRVLKLEVKSVRREKIVLQSETVNVDALRQEIYKAQKDLLRERTRVKALEDELQSPVNIHRWRKLGGSDPATFELITRIHALQKRLIGKTEEVLEKELLLQQRDKMYADLKALLARQPGPELMEELRLVRRVAKQKTRECRSLASEINMYQSQVHELRFDCDKLNKELQDSRRKYYAETNKERTHPGRYLNGAMSHQQRELDQLEHKGSLGLPALPGASEVSTEAC